MSNFVKRQLPVMPTCSYSPHLCMEATVTCVRTRLDLKANRSRRHVQEPWPAKGRDSQVTAFAPTSVLGPAESTSCGIVVQTCSCTTKHAKLTQFGVVAIMQARGERQMTMTMRLVHAVVWFSALAARVSLIC